MMSIEQQNEIIHANNQAKLEYWKNYGKELESQFQGMTSSLQEAKASDVAYSVSYKKLVDELLENINQGNDYIQNNCANNYAISQMRDRLINEIATTNDPKQSELLNPEKQLQLQEEDWKYFMENNNVKQRAPFPWEKP